MAALSFLFKEVSRRRKIGKSEISLANVLYFFVGIFFTAIAFLLKKNQALGKTACKKFL